MDYLDQEVIPDFLGGECLVRPRGPGRQEGAGRGLGGGQEDVGGAGAGLVLEAAPKTGDSSRKEGPFLGAFKHSEQGRSFQKSRHQASHRLAPPVFPTTHRPKT